MAKSEYMIKMDFKNAMNQADKLEDAARDIEKTAKTDLAECMKRIGKSWKGESANAYRQKGQKVAEKLIAIAKKLHKTAETIREIAENTYRAEMKALELANKRKY